jgi:protease II
VVCAREEDKDHRYSVEHHGQHLYILTNRDGAVNSKLMRTSGTETTRDFVMSIVRARR